MTAAQLLRSCQARPFHKFAMHLADGRELLVKHPELLLLTGGGRIATLRLDSGLDEAIDVLMIVSVRPLADQETQTRK